MPSGTDATLGQGVMLAQEIDISGSTEAYSLPSSQL